MTFTNEQKTELSMLHKQYEHINKLSNEAGLNPDKLINEFNFKFMVETELNLNIFDERSTKRQKAFQNNHFPSHKSCL